MKLSGLLIIIVWMVLIMGCSGNGDNEDASPSPTAEPGVYPEQTPPETSPDTPFPSINMPEIDTLTGNTWMLKSVNDSSEKWQYDDEGRIELNFSMQGNRYAVKGYSGCNTYAGVFSIVENALYINEISQTERACLNPDIMYQEDLYLDALYEAYSFYFADDGETLVISYGVALPSELVFQPKPVPSPSPTPVVSPTPKPLASPSESPIPSPTPQIRPGTVMVSLYLGIGQSGTQPKSCEPSLINIGFYPPGSRSQILMNPDLALFYFSGTSTCIMTASEEKSMVTVGPVNPGTYDIIADSPTTLLNVKRNVYIE